MLGRLRGSTGFEEDGGNCPLRYDSEQKTMEGKQPKADQETTQEAVCCGAVSPCHASGGMWLRQVCRDVQELEKSPAAIRLPQ
ncbi:hypothetical protein NDU88_002181 [Pleurodeles waltl]|uniref:Uncharacterized protein n=1 Tax=Pleurodeles waltl TaxID=8319 RepID=A0AAV7U8Y1_PLEWA|nr:hypothetical protein NDU88_002181 [Pleurodeles waltl]